MTNQLKTVPVWYRMIKKLADTLSDLVKLIHFDEHNWYLLYSPWLGLSRSLRVSNRVSDPDPDPDPVGSGDFAWIRIRIRIQFLNFSGSGIRIRIRFLNFSGSGSGSGSGFNTRIPDPGSGSGSKILNFWKLSKKRGNCRWLLQNVAFHTFTLHPLPTTLPTVSFSAGVPPIIAFAREGSIKRGEEVWCHQAHPHQSG